MRRAGLAVLVVAVAMMMPLRVSGAPIAITWFNTDGFTFFGTVTDHNGSALPLSASSSTAGFLQLLWDGGDGIDSDAYWYGDGTGAGNDTVLAVWYFDDSGFGLPDGSFGSSNVASLNSDTDVGKVLYVRAWEMPASTYNSGVSSQVPTAHSGNYYGNSVSTYTVTAGLSQNFDAGSWQTDLQAIPEPTSLALFGIGLAVIVGARRRRR